MTIVTTHYRYKRPPKKRLSVSALDKPAPPPPANDDDKPPPKPAAIVTARQPKKAASLPAGLLADTDADHQHRGDAADALWREIVRRVHAT